MKIKAKSKRFSDKEHVLCLKTNGENWVMSNSEENIVNKGPALKF